MPKGAIYVGRPTRWGNPWRASPSLSASEAVELYKLGLRRESPDFFTELQGKDLACWCPLDTPCHADVLLAMANPEEKPS